MRACTGSLHHCLEILLSLNYFATLSTYQCRIISKLNSKFREIGHLKFFDDVEAFVRPCDSVKFHQAGLSIPFTLSAQQAVSQHGTSHDYQEESSEGEGNAYIVSVRQYIYSFLLQPLTFQSGLDNAGKTTILKKINGEDVLSVSPTLGFNIKTFVHGK